MKNLYKNLMIVLTLSLALTACGEDNKEDVSNSNVVESVEASKNDEELKKQQAEEKAKKELQDSKNKAIEELTNLKSLNAQQIADFTKKINESSKIDDIKPILDEAKKVNEANRVAEEKAKQLSEHYQKAKVSRVVDGDTIEVVYDGYAYKLRLIGVNTPETKHPQKGVEFFGKEASAFTEEKLNGKDIYLEKDVSDTDRYQRLLRYVWLTPPKDPLNPTYEEVRDNSFNGVLVRDGYANASTYPPDVKYSEWFSKIEAEARNNSRGLWNESARAEWEAVNVVQAQPQQQAAPAANPTQQGNWTQVTREAKAGKNTYMADVTQGPIKGNSKSGIYHVQGQQGYDKISVDNVVWFNTVEEAQAAGYRAAKR